MPEGSAGFSKKSNVIPLWGESDGTDKREPPHNIEAEHALLGALLSRNSLHEKIAEKLKPEHFYNPLNGRLYAEISRLIVNGRKADPVTLKGWIAKDADGNAAGGHRYLSGLIAATPHLENIVSYADLIREMWMRREAIASAERLIGVAHNPESQIEAEFSSIADHVDALTVANAYETNTTSNEAIAIARRSLDEAMLGTGKTTLSFGMPSVDRVIKLLPGRISVLGGATSMGKSALGWGWTTHLAMQIRDDLMRGKDCGGILGVSLEMHPNELMLRAACSIAKVPYDAAEAGEITPGDRSDLDRAFDQLDSMPIDFTSVKRLTPEQIRMRCRQAKRKFGGKLALIVIDHLTLVKAEQADSKNGGSWATMQVVNTLLELAKEMDCPMLVLAQLARDVTKREDHRPQITDLAWSSALEQAAHYIGLLHRPEYYLRKNEPSREVGSSPERFEKQAQAWQQQMVEWANRGVLFFDKVRGGQPRMVHLKFDGPTMTFTEDQARG